MAARSGRIPSPAHEQANTLSPRGGDGSAGPSNANGRGAMQLPVPSPRLGVAPPSPNLGNNAYLPSTSPKVPPTSSPRTGTSIGGGHHRKTSSTVGLGLPISSATASTPGLWIRLFSGGGGGGSAGGVGGGGTSNGQKRGTSRDRRELPSYGNTTGSKRAFYTDVLRGGDRVVSTPWTGGTGNGGRLNSIIFLIRNIILRPLYVLGRRGPLIPILGALLFILFFLTYSTSPSSQSVKLRVQGAVGPYIPQRAADAMNWKGRQAQMPWHAGGEGVVKDRNGRIIHKPLPGTKGSKSDLSPQSRSPAASLVLPPPRNDSRIVLVEGQPHPIPAMMERAKKRWEELKGRQSQTFSQSVKEYERRYKRRPPKGFDKWYAFAKAHKVLMIDEFDLIDKDLKIYRAFRPAAFRARVANIPVAMDTTWTIRVEKGKVHREGPLGHHDRARGVVSLMERFAHDLPDMSIVYNGHDGARVAIIAEERIRLESMVDRGEYEEVNEPQFWPREFGPEPHWGMAVFCPPGSAVRAPGFDYGWPSIDSTGLEMPPNEEGTIGTLLEDPKGYSDVCNSPQYRHYHSTTSWVYSHHPTVVMPLFTPGVQTTFGDIHALIVEQLDLESQHDPTWEERPFTSLQWRGQTSGPLWEAKTPWKTTHRARLHLLSHQETGSRMITVTDEKDLMRSVEVPNYRLNPLLLDAGMVGPAVQCVKEDGTCDKMFEVFQGYDKRISFDRASLYKYVLDVDGNSWSGRFRRLMMSNAAVVKSTIFPEFWTDWAIPWLHYIPMQVDYSDMWDIMAFFRGGINGEGAHDQLGREIALAGKEWVRQCYRWADLEAYQFRLLLEYGRLYTDESEPGSNDYMGDGSEEPMYNGRIRGIR